MDITLTIFAQALAFAGLIWLVAIRRREQIALSFTATPRQDAEASGADGGGGAS